MTTMPVTPISFLQKVIDEKDQEIKRLHIMMDQYTIEDTKQIYGLHDTINEWKKVVETLCNHIEYLGYFIDEDFDSNDPKYKHANFVLAFNHVRNGSRNLKKSLE